MLNPYIDFLLFCLSHTQVAFVCRSESTSMSRSCKTKNVQVIIEHIY